ncbi:MAG TPA: hypothetical protein PKA90_15840 [Ignavibacteria bacterium]|nr:hypothetical protein [Ignavibacteria bacterium]HMR41890.1 hypothetical protein [Ignavibacteria bacterium]
MKGDLSVEEAFGVGGPKVSYLIMFIFEEVGCKFSGKAIAKN